MDHIEELLQPGDGLLLVDVQNDFCPGGALPISGGDGIVPLLNHWIAAASARGVPIYASRDWHPAGHISFQEQGGPWPVHCLQDTPGAMFHPDLQLPGSVVKVTKGVRFDHDQNSALDATGLEVRLRRDGVRRLWIGGLAEDVCVRASVLDALQAGFAVVLIGDGTRPVTWENGVKARREMQDAGAEVHITGPTGR
ncbi:isochorismatase family protein [Sedimenticola hydrogenitrophicus]|uniref:isochorismatase family protein n=1 Tax=Sedimenticola hydrogenitrophicus TaxID=2967975 RepID=UPI0023B14D9A|nr:isochorismatase family protein [Sedimenticola hydrogenitrophicus]